MFSRLFFSSSSDSRPSIKGAETGVAVIEVAVTLFLFILITVSLLEFGRALDTYYRYVQVARDAARLGSWLGEIDRSLSCRTSAPNSENNLREAFCSSTVGNPAEHLLIHDRASALESIIPDRAARDNFNAREVYFQTSIDTQGDADANNDLLVFSIDVDYQPILPVLLLFNRIPLNIQVTAPLAAPGVGVKVSGSDVALLDALYRLGGGPKGGGPAGDPIDPTHLSNNMWVGLNARYSTP